MKLKKTLAFPSMVKEAWKIMKVVDNSAQVKRAFDLVNSMTNITYVLLTENVSYRLTMKLLRESFMDMDAALFIKM
jgi:hypothetical protein